ncbi:MAG: hypothetical protein H7831_10140 [Magnetococcus sp. WYHC-3]
MVFANIVDEVVQPFTARTGIDVVVAVEIRATSAKGFTADLQRAVRENCITLRFQSAEFEE